TLQFRAVESGLEQAAPLAAWQVRVLRVGSGPQVGVLDAATQRILQAGDRVGGCQSAERAIARAGRAVRRARPEHPLKYVPPAGLREVIGPLWVGQGHEGLDVPNGVEVDPSGEPSADGRHLWAVAALEELQGSPDQRVRLEPRSAVLVLLQRPARQAV